MSVRTIQLRAGGLLLLILALLGSVWVLGAGADAGAPAQAAFPAGAREIAPDIFALGARVENGVRIEGYAIVRRALPAKPDGSPGGGGRKGGGGDGGGETTSTCFSYLANGAAWSETTDYVVDGTSLPVIGDVLTADLEAGVLHGIGEWNTVTAMAVFGADLVGDAEIATIGNSTNGANEVAFRAISDTGVIAVTYIWGIFRGPPSGRGLVEWDMLLDLEAEWDWQSDASGATSAPNDGIYVVDLKSILTHELGHALALGHPADDCTEETMYRYYSEAEITKRDLAAGDIAGAQSLYG